MKEALQAPNQNSSLFERYQNFPNITFEAFRHLSPEDKKLVLLRHPLITSDAYNRTMEFLLGQKIGHDSVYTLQLRRNSHNYHVIAGVSNLVNRLANITITKEQVQFANEYYQQLGGIRFFDFAKWMDIVENHNGKLPITIDALPDGSFALPSEPILRVRGDGEIIAHFEHYFHRLFYTTAVATNAHAISQIISPNRFIEVGLRGSLSDELHLSAGEAMYTGGGIFMTSNDALAGLYPQFQSVGTIGHRFIQAFEKEEEAFRYAIGRLDSVSLLVDTHDSYNGIDLAIKLKKEYRHTQKRIWIRLDSGDVEDQVLYALNKLKNEGLLDSSLDKIIVEGIEDISEIAQIEQKIIQAGFDPSKNVLYGAGGLLISKGTTRSDLSSGFKLSCIDGRATMKKSNSVGKHSIPGFPTVQVANGERIVSQTFEANGKDVLIPVFSSGQALAKEDIVTANRRILSQYPQFAHLIGKEPNFSHTTRHLIAELIKGGEKS